MGCIERDRPSDVPRADNRVDFPETWQALGQLAARSADIMLLLPQPTCRNSLGRAMNQHLSLVSLVVADYDEAIAFFTGPLNFELCEDAPRGGGKRWVVVRPRGGTGCGLLLGAGGWFGSSGTHRQPDRRAGLPVPGNGRFRARPRAHDRGRRAVCRAAAP